MSVCLNVAQVVLMLVYSNTFSFIQFCLSEKWYSSFFVFCFACKLKAVIILVVGCLVVVVVVFLYGSSNQD